MNWDAWAAIGTVAAVFAAVFAPAIQRRFVRRKANALFFFAYMHDVVATLASLRRINSIWPVGGEGKAADLVRDGLFRSKALREEYAKHLSDHLQALSAREVDLSKWPAVDMENAAAVVMAIEATKGVLAGATAIPDLREEKLEDSFSIVGKAIDAAIYHLANVELLGSRRVQWLMRDQAKHTNKS